ncbi:5691_t:CDS:2, partial [Racocetra fulgida]
NFPNSSAIITSSFAIPVTNISNSAIPITNTSNSATPVTNTSNSAAPVTNTSNPITHTTSNNPAINITTTSSNPATYIASNSSNSASNSSTPTNFNNPTRSTTYSKINFHRILAELITPNNENEMSIDSSSEEESNENKILSLSILYNKAEFNEILENRRISINKAKSTAYNEILAKNSHLTKD